MYILPPHQASIFHKQKSRMTSLFCFLLINSFKAKENGPVILDFNSMIDLLGLLRISLVLSPI